MDWFSWFKGWGRGLLVLVLYWWNELCELLWWQCRVNSNMNIVNMAMVLTVTNAVIGQVSSERLCCLWCGSHLDSKSAEPAFAKDGYFCPQCFSKYCDLPVDCVTCGTSCLVFSCLCSILLFLSIYVKMTGVKPEKSAATLFSQSFYLSRSPSLPSFRRFHKSSLCYFFHLLCFVYSYKPWCVVCLYIYLLFYYF